MRRWVTCYPWASESNFRRAPSEREIRLASDELRQRNKLQSSRYKLTARKLAQFLKSIESEEILLRQRLADLASRQIVVRSGLLASDYLFGTAENGTGDNGSSTSAGEKVLNRDTSTHDFNPSVSQIYKTI